MVFNFLAFGLQLASVAIHWVDYRSHLKACVVVGGPGWSLSWYVHYY
jgi:hypothetical protein